MAKTTNLHSLVADIRDRISALNQENAHNQETILTNLLKPVFEERNMARKIMRQYVLYHGGGCADGFGAAFAAWLKFGDEAEYIPVSYGKPAPEMKPMSDIFIVDFSYSKEALSNLAKNHRAIVVLDHHKTAEAELSHGAGIVGVEIKFDMTKSGAVLAWEYFHPNTPVPEFFLYLQDRDLWQWKLPASREFSAALRSYPMEFNLWAQISNIGDPDERKELTTAVEKRLLNTLKNEGNSILRFQNQQVEMQVKSRRGVCVEFYNDERKAALELWSNVPDDAFFHDTLHLLDGVTDRFVVPAVNCTCFISEVCEKLLELYPSAPFVAAYRDTKDGKREWSLRSRKDFDCSVIAKAFGGGGHAQASGFTQ